MEKYILDANLFFNMEAGFNFGKKTEEVVVNLTKYANKLKNQAVFYMPPRVVDEFLSFFKDKKQAFIEAFLASITIKSVSLKDVSIPVGVFYQLVEDIRLRNLRGLRIGEEEIEKAAGIFCGKKPENKKEFQIGLGQATKSFRQRFRQATRFGFLDSLADLDLIVLSKEVDGFLISSDEGVIRWGRIFGVKEMPTGSLKRRLENLLASPFHRE